MKSSDTGAAGGRVIYDPAVAKAFFESAGSMEKAAQGDTLFLENEKGKRWLLQRDKMYYLLEGEIALSVGGKAIDTLKAGEVFGEMAALGDFPRSATAVARTGCRLIALDEKRFQKAMHAQPDFALAMMNAMIGRLRLTIATLGMRGALSDQQRWSEGKVFDKSLIAELKHALGDPVPDAPEEQGDRQRRHVGGLHVRCDQRHRGGVHPVQDGRENRTGRGVR
jgi:CRP/FNR family cyclic AMP-dependent transcriptional regulator